MKKSLLHIVQKTNIVDDFKDFNSAEFPDYDHKYLYIKHSGLVEVIKLISQSKEIHIHGLFDRWLPILIFIFGRGKKVFWYLWGGDVYNDILKASWKHKIYNALAKRIFVKNFVTYLVTYLPGDVEFVRDHYGFDGMVINSNLYTSNVVGDRTELLDEVVGDRILLGNSAVVENNHIAGIKAISRNSFFEKYEILIPLSYGDEIYRKSIEEFSASSTLRIKLLKNFMSLTEYRKTISQVSICVFYHEYQMAMGNIIFLLFSKKLVFLNPETSPYRFFLDNGVFVLKLSDLDSFSGSELYERELSKNRVLISEIFSRKRLVMQYRELYEQ